MRQALLSETKPTKAEYQQDSDPEENQELPKAKIFIERLEEIAHDPANGIDEDGFQQHIDTMMFGGNDTSAQALSNTLLTLGMYPDWQEKVYQEIVDVVPHGPVSYEDLTKLTLLEMFLKQLTTHYFGLHKTLNGIFESCLLLLLCNAKSILANL